MSDERLRKRLCSTDRRPCGAAHRMGLPRLRVSLLEPFLLRRSAPARTRVQRPPAALIAIEQIFAACARDLMQRFGDSIAVVDAAIETSPPTGLLTCAASPPRTPCPCEMTSPRAGAPGRCSGARRAPSGGLEQPSQPPAHGGIRKRLLVVSFSRAGNTGAHAFRSSPMTLRKD